VGVELVLKYRKEHRLRAFENKMIRTILIDKNYELERLETITKWRAT
jgi:hypothetical protein